MTSADTDVSRGTTDSIAAISTAPGRGGIGVVRISGRGLAGLAQAVTGKVLSPRHATHAIFRDDFGQPLDDGMALYFPSPHSFTGEDVLELHGHGGQAGLTNILRRCMQLGCRLARPGEFTERAFLNGKLDLAQAEGVADMIDAGSTQAALSAARTLTGEFSRRVNALTSHLIDLRVHVEATIDFPEEEISLADRQNQHEKLVHLCRLEGELVREASQGAVLREGLTVVLIGKPNVGKSSLLNRLAGDEIAIVTAIPGTTRDLIRATVHLQGVPVHLIDTAGLRDTDDVVEKVGIERTWDAIRLAGAAMLISESGKAVDKENEQIVAKLRPNTPIIRVHNKADLDLAAVVSRETVISGGLTDLYVSALTGEGVESLRAWLLTTAGWQPGSDGVFLARERHLVALRAAAAHLTTAMSVEGQFDLLAEELRLAQRQLATITGEFTPDDLLGEIFSRFCIGK